MCYKNFINTKIKFIFDEVTEENHEEYREGWKRVLQRLCRRSSEVGLGNFSEESKLNPAIAEKALLRNDSNIPHVSFRKKLRKTNHKTIEYVRMAEIGMILTVQRSLILGRVTEERRKNPYFAKS